ncbi:MAG: Uma2 family endonuclease [Vulcanimicrobiaceae bacterium]
MQVTVPQPYLVESKPATEWLLGEPVQKMSPRRAHGVIQLEFGYRLLSWAVGRGDVASEWRVWVEPPNEYSRYLVPDIAYVSYDRLARDAGEAAEEPHVAPNVVVEIVSPSERNILIAHKIAVYLSAGTELVILIDPQKRTVALHDPEVAQILGPGGRIEHAAMPGFTCSIDELFATLERR